MFHHAPVEYIQPCFCHSPSGTFLPTYLSAGILKRDPFQQLDADGVGQLIRKVTTLHPFQELVRYIDSSRRRERLRFARDKTTRRLLAMCPLPSRQLLKRGQNVVI